MPPQSRISGKTAQVSGISIRFLKHQVVLTHLPVPQQVTRERTS